jgi:hypothetical protein
MCNEVAATRLRNGRVVAHGRMKFKWKYEIFPFNGRMYKWKYEIFPFLFRIDQ